MPKQTFLKQIKATRNRAHFSLRHSEDIDQELHEDLKAFIIEWAVSQGFDESKARAVWTAIYEAIQNALRWGSDPGESIYIGLQATEKGFLEAEIGQPRKWPGGAKKLKEHASGVPRGKVRKEDLTLGGVVVMQRLADDISVREEGRKIVMRFVR